VDVDIPTGRLRVGSIDEWQLPGSTTLPSPQLIAIPERGDRMRLFAAGYDKKPFIVDDPPQFPVG
jgi:hypothetical protein